MPTKIRNRTIDRTVSPLVSKIDAQARADISAADVKARAILAQKAAAKRAAAEKMAKVKSYLWYFAGAVLIGGALVLGVVTKEPKPRPKAVQEPTP